jgi:RNA polymerase sigma factor (sigma-70 family)
VTDEELIRSCTAKNHKGQRLLYQQFVSPMARLCFRYLRDEEEAKDTVTEGFLKIFESIHSFENRHPGALEAWIRKIMVNKCLMKLRSKQRFVFMSTEQEEIPQLSGTEEELSAEEIFQIISQLPDGYRTVFNLFAIEGYSHKEISELTGISESTSRSQLTHARNKMKQLLLKQGWK